jgi:hypothetical protein
MPGLLSNEFQPARDDEKDPLEDHPPTNPEDVCQSKDAIGWLHIMLFHRADLPKIRAFADLIAESCLLFCRSLQ